MAFSSIVLSLSPVLVSLLSFVTGVKAESSETFDAFLLIVGIAVCITLSCGCLGVYARNNNAI